MTRKDETEVLFPCPLCDQMFTDVVWHCIGCAHHWPLDVKSCKNCYAPLNERGTRKHKRKCVEVFLRNKVTQKLSDQIIADVCGVSAATVGSIRRSNLEFQADERTTKDGRKISRARQASGAGKRKRK